MLESSGSSNNAILLSLDFERFTYTVEKISIEKSKDEFDEAIIVDEKTVTDKQMKKSVQIKAYLMQTYNQDIYKLIVESSLEDITNQNCIYLQKKDDDCIVQRWER